MGKNGRELTPAERRDATNRHEKFAEQVERMFVAGESYSAISAATGIPRSTVGHMCIRLMGKYADERYGDIRAALGRELNILDQLTRKNLRRAQNGDPVAARIVLEAHIRRSKLLGLEKAVKAEITIKTAQDVEIERLMASLGDLDPGGSLEPVEGSEDATDAHVAAESEGSE